jgi:hypothetical protein
VPWLPVMPWQRTLVFMSTRMAMRTCPLRAAKRGYFARAIRIASRFWDTFGDVSSAPFGGPRDCTFSMQRGYVLAVVAIWAGTLFMRCRTYKNNVCVNGD